jgi:hypothetical protein
MALSDTSIRAAKPKDKPYKMADAGGLFLLVNPTGSKLWRLKYRIDGREKLLAIGAYPAVTLGRQGLRQQCHSRQNRRAKSLGQHPTEGQPQGNLRLLALDLPAAKPRGTVLQQGQTVERHRDSTR